MYTAIVIEEKDQVLFFNAQIWRHLSKSIHILIYYWLAQYLHSVKAVQFKQQFFGISLNYHHYFGQTDKTMSFQIGVGEKLALSLDTSDTLVALVAKIFRYNSIS